MALDGDEVDDDDDRNMFCIPPTLWVNADYAEQRPCKLDPAAGTQRETCPCKSNMSASEGGNLGEEECACRPYMCVFVSFFILYHNSSYVLVSSYYNS